MSQEDNPARMIIILYDEMGEEVGQIEVERAKLKKMTNAYPDRAAQSLLGKMIADLIPKENQ